jgi:hypothetical protein
VTSVATIASMKCVRMGNADELRAEGLPESMTDRIGRTLGPPVAPANLRRQ